MIEVREKKPRKKKEKPFKRKEVKRPVKQNPLDILFNEEQRQKCQEAAKRGGVFICTGTRFAQYTEVFKGLRMYMKSPTFNGMALYDTHVLCDKAYNRPVYLLTLNDAGNQNILHSIREIKAGKIYNRYTYHVQEGLPEFPCPDPVTAPETKA